jgi:prevent-host-death family protein
MEIGIKAAKTDLSKLIKAAIGGEKVVITDRGKPLVRLVPEAPRPKDLRRGYGSLKGLLKLPPGWDSPEADKELLSMFENLE